MMMILPFSFTNANTHVLWLGRKFWLLHLAFCIICANQHTCLNDKQPASMLDYCTCHISTNERLADRPRARPQPVLSDKRFTIEPVYMVALGYYVASRVVAPLGVAAAVWKKTRSRAR
jgi:hypothetical protein